MSTECLPSRVSEALKDPRWAAAMMEEMHALDKNNSWDIVDLILPKGQHAIGCKWM